MIFCKHKYNAIGLDLSGIWTVYECEKCSKLMKGGAPRCTIMVMPKRTPDGKPTHHNKHTYKFLRSISEYVCTGCEEIKRYESKGNSTQSFYGEINDEDQNE